MQQLDPAPAGVVGGSAAGNRTLAIVALGFAAVGFALGLISLVAQLATFVVPTYGATSYSWLLAVSGGAIGLWPSLIGGVLGLMALLGARRHGFRKRLSLWTIALAVAGPLASAAGMLALYVQAWII